MTLYQSLMQMLYRARKERVTVADLSPQKPKQPKKETLIVKDPLFVILALYEGLTIEQVTSIYDNLPQENLAHNPNKMPYNSVATKAEILIGELTKKGFFPEAIEVSVMLSNIEDLVNARYPSSGKRLDEELVKKREKYRLELYKRKMAGYEAMVTIH